MIKPTILENFQFTLVDPSELDDIKAKVSNFRSGNDIAKLSKNFKPFEVPGTLQSNLVSIEKINPFYEKNMEFFNSFEQYTLLLISNLPQLDLSKNYIFKI